LLLMEVGADVVAEATSARELPQRAPRGRFLQGCAPRKIIRHDDDAGGLKAAEACSPAFSQALAALLRDDRSQLGTPLSLS